jgi:hypothetical protein
MQLNASTVEVVLSLMVYLRFYNLSMIAANDVVTSFPARKGSKQVVSFKSKTDTIDNFFLENIYEYLAEFLLN